MREIEEKIDSASKHNIELSNEYKEGELGIDK
jgi:hypothetical protein